ncbi:MAG TPA: hypothetical protein VFD64_07740 [Gemmatimonadaceae bacterium]|nr:hypothetical protein [Gemmatimonadaceae bacterium]
MPVLDGHSERSFVPAGAGRRRGRGSAPRPGAGGATAQRDGGLALFGSHGVVLIWKDRVLLEQRHDTTGVRGSRFNDAIADPLGRVLRDRCRPPAGKATCTCSNSCTIAPPNVVPSAHAVAPISATCALLAGTP